MEAVAYSVFRKDLRGYMRKVSDDAAPMLVTAKDPRHNTVVMNADDYESLMETIRIYENPYLYNKIMEGIRDAKEGWLTEHELIEDHDE